MHETPDANLEQSLASVPLLAALGEKQRAELAARTEQVGLRAGEWLFREGDPADSLYLVLNGRLDAISSDAGGVIGTLGRGDQVGELAILTGEPRSASVRARRDSLLLRLSREQFEDLLADPDVSFALLRGLGEQLHATRTVQDTEALPSVFVVAAPSPGLSAAPIAEELRRRLARWTGVVVLGSEDVPEGDETARTRYARLLESGEREHGRVLLVVDEAGASGEWAAFCTDQADRVLVVTDCADDPPTGSIAQGCDLMFSGSHPSGASMGRWMDAMRPHATYRVAPDDPDRAKDLDRAARRLSGRSIGIALSGGGARGFAHIGALGALEEAGVEIDRIGGCSMGALVGALYAGGRSPAEILDICRAELVERNPMNDYTLPVAGLIRRQKAEAMLLRLYGEELIEWLPRDYFCVSADLVSGALIEHRSGPVYRGVGASICLPGLSPPVPEGEMLLVDGGVLNNLPIQAMAAVGEGPLIAADVSAKYEPNLRASERPRVRQIQNRVRRLIIGEGQPVPPLTETLFRTLVLGSIDTAQAARRYADVVIEPEVAEFGMTEFGSLDRIVGAGREAAERMIEVRGTEWTTEPIRTAAAAP